MAGIGLRVSRVRFCWQAQAVAAFLARGVVIGVVEERKGKAPHPYAFHLTQVLEPRGRCEREGHQDHSPHTASRGSRQLLVRRQRIEVAQEGDAKGGEGVKRLGPVLWP